MGNAAEMWRVWEMALRKCGAYGIWRSGNMAHIGNGAAEMWRIWEMAQKRCRAHIAPKKGRAKWYQLVYLFGVPFLTIPVVLSDRAGILKAYPYFYKDTRLVVWGTRSGQLLSQGGEFGFGWQ